MCQTEGCMNPVRAKGLCGNHYNQSLPNYRQHACVSCGTQVIKEGSRCRSCKIKPHSNVARCKIDGCDQRHHACGLCKPHFEEWYLGSHPRSVASGPPALAGRWAIAFDACRARYHAARRPATEDGSLALPPAPAPRRHDGERRRLPQRHRLPLGRTPRSRQDCDSGPVRRGVRPGVPHIGRRMGFSDYARGALTAAATISTSVLGMALHFPDVALWMVLVPIPVLLFVLRFLAFWR